MAREIAESDHPAASERNELCEFNSDVQLRCASHADEFAKSQDSLPEIPTIIHSHCEVNVGLEALASLTSSSVPAKHLHQCEPFNLWIELSDPRVEIVAVPSVNTALENLDVVLRHARAVSPTPSGSRAWSRVAGTLLARASEERRASLALRRGRIKTRTRRVRTRCLCSRTRPQRGLLIEPRGAGELDSPP